MKRRRPPETAEPAVPRNQDLVSLQGMHTHKLILHAVASVFMAPVQELVADRRSSSQVAFARQVAMYLAHVGCGFSKTRVGELFGRNRATVAHGCRVVEDRRDDPRLDRSLNVLEVVLRSRAQPSQ
jgi:chromosomal replication initiation ATPase DnaA